jgi:hypothetical protein
MVPAMHKVIVVTVVLPISTALITGITEVINTPVLQSSVTVAQLSPQKNQMIISGISRFLFWKFIIIPDF